ncbi:hypothetical protein ABEB36_008730 [Hypothenemus hampei]|uniref:Uncharacterized protein n=1 Tax=Hypothenemus hampei TaxID=57062 RepID=A0ABD1ERX5_HYPHA
MNDFDEVDADQFNKEWEAKTKCMLEISKVTLQLTGCHQIYGNYPAIPEITAGYSRVKTLKERALKLSIQRN